MTTAKNQSAAKMQPSSKPARTAAPAPLAAKDALAPVKPIVGHLTAVLADTYALGVKTHGAHWNVRGAGFFRLHTAFEQQYQALFLAADEVAERIRALGSDAPGSMRQLLELSSVGEPPSSSSRELVTALRDDHRALSEACRQALAEAQEDGDEATADLLIKRTSDHDKVAWMLEATLED